jgi:hypothetical protein
MAAKVTACLLAQAKSIIFRQEKESRVLTLFKKSESFQGWQGHYESNMRGRFIM